MKWDWKNIRMQRPDQKEACLHWVGLLLLKPIKGIGKNKSACSRFLRISIQLKRQGTRAPGCTPNFISLKLKYFLMCHLSFPIWNNVTKEGIPLEQRGMSILHDIKSAPLDGPHVPWTRQLVVPWNLRHGTNKQSNQVEMVVKYCSNSRAWK